MDISKVVMICHAFVIFLYLQHYVAKLSTYAQLVCMLNEWEFFTSEHAILYLEGNTTQCMFSLSFSFVLLLMFGLGDSNCIWESVEHCLSNMEGILQELHKNIKNYVANHNILCSEPANLEARLSDPCAVYSTHLFEKCGGHKHCR